MSDARRYALWPDPRSGSRALESWKSFRFQKLSPPFTMGAGKWPLILKLGHNIYIWSGQFFYICPRVCVMWIWTWQKRQLWKVDRHYRLVIYYFSCYKYLTMWTDWWRVCMLNVAFISATWILWILLMVCWYVCIWFAVCSLNWNLLYY